MIKSVCRYIARNIYYSALLCVSCHVMCCLLFTYGDAFLNGYTTRVVLYNAPATQRTSHSVSHTNDYVSFNVGFPNSKAAGDDTEIIRTLITEYMRTYKHTYWIAIESNIFSDHNDLIK